MVRPPMVARRSGVPCRGHFPSFFQRACSSHVFGGSELSRPIVRSDARATKRTLRQSSWISFGRSAPAFRRGAIRARQRISSAIQFPIPGNPLLQKQHRLDRRPGMPPNEIPHRYFAEL